MIIIYQNETGDFEYQSKILDDLCDISNQMRDPTKREDLQINMDDPLRHIFIYYHDQQPAGYVILNLSPRYAPFQRLNIPEFQDLSVAPLFQRQGIGRALVQFCESFCQKSGHDYLGAAVALTANYGTAQQLYAKMGYIPDGCGVTYNREPIRQGSFQVIDDQLTLMLIKEIGA
jgi:GNAT superfamily N-acetyltransferase